METKPRSSNVFCARPGCGIALSGHHVLARGCAGFVQPGSKEARELKQAERTSHIDMSQLRSDLEEALTMAEAFTAHDKAIALATDQLKSGLTIKDLDPEGSLILFRAALATLGNLGSS